ncbi:MAG: CoA pyrophosphatase [Bacteroidota bacterium]
MDFDTLYDRVKKIDSDKLPGQESQFKMVPSIRPKISWEEVYETKPTLASVLLLVYPDGEDNSKFVLIQRKEYNGAHSAQISLPGGKLEEDENELEAALRETYEEIGVDSGEIEVVTPLSKVWVSPSKFLVTPFLGILKEKPSFVKDSYEVEEIIEVNMTEFLDDTCICEEIVSSNYVQNLKVPAFRLGDRVVWGATAMILSEFRDAVI